MRICTIILFVAFILLDAGECKAQVTVQGTTTDSLHNPIPNVNIYATGPDSTNIKTYDYSNENGEFSLQLDLNQAYLLHVSSIGYKKQVINIPAHSASDTLVKNITLQEETQQLKELVVEGEKPAIIAKEDTVIFLAESFMRGNEESVEDILRLLPGITVNADGRIRANGKTVTKVLIGDDDLFGYNYQLLTKNFTAQAIETVSIYEHYQENEALQDISKSEETVLNLGLKEEFKVDFFGTASGYYDLDQNYQVDGNVVSITKNFKGYLFESANNIGDNPVGNVYNLLQSGSSLPFQSSTTLGGNTGSSPFIGTSAHRVSRLDQEQYLDNQTSFHALSGIYNPTENLKIKGVGYFLPANRRINQQFITTYDPSLELPYLVEQQNTQKDIDAWLGNLTAKYTFSNKSNLKYEGEFNTFPETEQTNRVFQDDPLQTRLETRESQWNQHLRYTRKVAEKKAYRIRARYKNTSTQQDFFVNPAISGGPFNSDSTPASVLQQSESDNSYIGTDFKYWSRKPNSLFSFRLGTERQSNSLENRIADQPTFTNERHWNRHRTFLTLSYRRTLFTHFEAHVQLTGNYVRNITNVQADVDDNLFYLSPEVGFKYKFGRRQEIQMNYAFNQDLPGFKTLFNGRRLTSYRTIDEGTNNFTLLPSNNFSASYRYGNWQDNFVVNTFFNYSTSQKNYTTANMITPTYNFGTYRIVEDQEFINARLGVDQFFHVLQSNLAAEYNFNNFSYTSFFNNTGNKIRFNSHLFSTFIRTAFVGPFNFSIGAEYSFSNSRNATNDNLSRHRYFTGFANANIEISENFSAEAEYRHYWIENAGDYNFLNATLKYKLIEDKLTLYLDAINILDETSFQTINLGSFSNYQQRDALNPRYVMIGAKINVR